MTTPSTVQYARTSDGLDIAYTIIGDGPVDALMVNGFTTHLDFLGDSPWHAYWMRRLGERFRVITFDKRGSGLSDRSMGLGSVEDRVRDLTAVMDAAGSERAHIIGISEGGPISLSFAATYPERVDKLVLYGAFARVPWAPDYPIGIELELANEFAAMTEQVWGTGEVFSTMFLTHAPDPESALRFMAKFERNACTRQMAGEMMRRNIELDVRGLLPGITAPTIVVHNTGDSLVDIELGRYLGKNIPHAEYVEGQGDYHCTWQPREFAPLMDQIMRFLCDEAVAQTAARETTRQTRAVATVLFTDIVGSTDLAASLGDTQWSGILREHDKIADEATRGFGGRVVKSTGDGMLAVFDGPSRAIGAVRELRNRLGPLDLQLRAGIHTGEVERNGDDVAGLGVHIAARVMCEAGPGEVVTSRTVKDLAVGSGIEFTELGARVLKGVPGEWDLFQVP